MTKKAQSKGKKAVVKASPKGPLKGIVKSITQAVQKAVAGKTTPKAAIPAAKAPVVAKPLRKPEKIVKPPKPISKAAQLRLDNMCRDTLCENQMSSGGYCRMHYIQNWKKIKRKELILKEGKLNRYIEELVNKYPDKYIEAIRLDLASEQDFLKSIADLEIEEGATDFDAEGESLEGLVTTIRPDVDDEGEF